MIPASPVQPPPRQHARRRRLVHIVAADKIWRNAIYVRACIHVLLFCIIINVFFDNVRRPAWVQKIAVTLAGTRCNWSESVTLLLITIGIVFALY